MTRVDLDKIKVGGRNFIRVGDTCKVLLYGKTQRKPATIRRIYENGVGDIEVEVAVGSKPKEGRDARPVRTVTLDRITRVAQTKGGEQRG